MSYLIDTNVLSEVRKGDSADTNVRRWWATVDAAEIHLSVIVVGEIRRGIERILHRRDLSQAAVFERWLGQLEASYADRLLAIDARVADMWGRLQTPNPLPVVHGLLAATALVHDLSLVTRNIRDVATTGVRCLNPFDPSPSS